MGNAQMLKIGKNNMVISQDRRRFGGFYIVSDMMAMIGAIPDGTPAIVIGYSRGDLIVPDAVLRYPKHFDRLPKSLLQRGEMSFYIVATGQITTEQKAQRRGLDKKSGSQVSYSDLERALQACFLSAFDTIRSAPHAE